MNNTMLDNVRSWSFYIKNSEYICLSHSAHGVVSIIKSNNIIQVKQNGAIVKTFTDQRKAISFCFEYIHKIMTNVIPGKLLYNIAS